MRTIQVATPFSELFNVPEARQRILALSDAVELRKPGQEKQVPGPYLYHCGLSLVAAWPDQQRKKLESMALKVGAGHMDLELISFHVLSRYAVNDIEHGAFVGRGRAYSESELRDNACKNIEFVRSVLADNVLLLIENNNHLGTDAYDTVTDPGFLAQLVRDNSLYLLWDIAHAKISAFNSGMPVERYIDSLPLSRCVQVHLSRSGIRNGKAFDSHMPIEEEDLDFFIESVTRLPQLKFVTIEYYRESEKLVVQLERLRHSLGNLNDMTEDQHYGFQT